MPRGGLGGGRAEGYNYSQLAALPHDSHYATAGEAVEDYNRQNSSPRYLQDSLLHPWKEIFAKDSNQIIRSKLMSIYSVSTAARLKITKCELYIYLIRFYSDPPANHHEKFNVYILRIYSDPPANYYDLIIVYFQ
jgi:hypothetical protein